MSVLVETELSVHGLPAIVLDNGRLRVTILPTSGGRVWQVQCLRTGRRLLWNNPRIAPARLPIGTNFDDTFSGGWDVLFPNDLPETLAGEPYPDHGELWNGSWRPRVERGPEGSAAVVLEFDTPISQCRLTKRIELEPTGSRLVVSESVELLGRTPLPALWKQHVALALDEGGAIELPGGRAELADWGTPRTGAAGDTYDWPMLNDSDLSQVLGPDDPAVEFQYVTELPEPWVGMRHPDGTRVKLRWESDVITNVWLFASHGAWRGNRVVVLEPCTGTPLSVTAGVTAGTHRVLQPGQRWSARFVVDVVPGEPHED